MVDEPAIRAAISKDFLEVVRHADGALLGRVVEITPAAAVADIERATRLGWVALRNQLAVSDSVRRLVGDTAYRALWRRSMLHSLGQWTLKPLIDGALRLFGTTPSGLTKIGPRAWALISRCAGELVLEAAPAPNEARLALVRFPTDLFASRSFILGMAGCIESVYDLCAAAGEVAISREDPVAGSALFELRWG